jgi:hypothetical protein
MVMVTGRLQQEEISGKNRKDLPRPLFHSGNGGIQATHPGFLFYKETINHNLKRRCLG